MEKCFDFVDRGTIWKITYDTSGNYRNWVILEQKSQNIQIKKKIPFIMFNPGSFNNEENFSKDKTFQTLLKMFINSGYQIEVLNLFNISEKDKKKLRMMQDCIRDNGNPIIGKLKRYQEGDKVVIQWGKLEKYAEAKAKLVFNTIKKASLQEIGLKKDNRFYYHPLKILWENKISEFRQKILSGL
tara:strand:- start:639 stop:1193 length:555 start_codon:yes stop_codon:yes gene_type:complete